MEIDTNAIVVLISCIVIFIVILSSYLEYREFLQYRKHKRKYPGGVIFDNPHEHLSGSEDYVNIFHKEFTYSLNHISRRPTYQELIETIHSIHPYDSKEAVISYLFVNNFLPKGKDLIKFLSDVQYKVTSRLLGNILNNIVRMKLNHIIESKNFYDSLLLFQSEGMILNGMCYLRLFDSNMNSFAYSEIQSFKILQTRQKSITTSVCQFVSNSDRCRPRCQRVTPTLHNFLRVYF